ncbi:hypothetical protein [Secundilactobacillus malefermentans]|uniref:hypothetical protein n=1 Tax=Secundilactobacillus malefermentans TaxID=176292 RepID=UPI0010585714|nr:hypothetical protein [Secundilactobacillus malefermentans]
MRRVVVALNFRDLGLVGARIQGNDEDELRAVVRLTPIHRLPAINGTSFFLRLAESLIAKLAKNEVVPRLRVLGIISETV